MNRKTRFARSRKHRLALTMKVELHALRVMQLIKSRMHVVVTSTSSANDALTKLGEASVQITLDLNALTKTIEQQYLNGFGNRKPKGIRS